MPDSNPNTVSHSIRQFMRPVVKLMLRNGIDLASCMGEVRRLYVDVAQDAEFASNKGKTDSKKKISVSRIALLTGINRKEVRRILDTKDDQDEPDRAYSNRAVRVISGWTKDRKFCDENGEPYVLSVGATNGERRFEDLVKAYSGDLTARVILDELIRVGSVSEENPGKVSLVGKGYVPYQSNEAMLAEGSAAIRDLASTVAHNISRTDGEGTLLQLTVAYDDVPTERLRTLRAIVTRRAREFIEEQDQTISEFDRSRTPEPDSPGRHRIGVGLYLFEDDLNE